MKEAYTPERRNGWLIWTSLAAVLLVGLGIFFYCTFLRQSKAELIEAVPSDALFLFEINDNEEFNSKVSTLQPFFNEAFLMDALPAFETVYHKLPAGNYDISMSGHQDENGMYLLFNTRIEKAAFKKLLHALSIDPANFTSFEQSKIYTYGTNYKSLKFVYINHILTVSDNIELVKKAIIQHTHPKNLLFNKEFKKLYALTEKNKKQNWLLLNNHSYSEYLSNFFVSDIAKKIQQLDSDGSWSAFQIRLSSNEIFLSGYLTGGNAKLNSLRNLQAKTTHYEDLLPLSTYLYLKKSSPEYTLCSFTMACDSNSRYDYLLVMQDSTKQSFSPFRSEELAEQYRSSHPNGIYATVDSMIAIKLPNFDAEKYTCFTENNGQYLFAENEKTLEAYRKDLQQNGSLKESRYFQFSNYNVANSNLWEYTFYNMGSGKVLQSSLSPKGKPTWTSQHLSILSFSCTDYSDELITLSIYLHFGN